MPFAAAPNIVPFAQFDAAPALAITASGSSDHEVHSRCEARNDAADVGCLTRHLVVDRSPAQRLLIVLVLPPLICLLFFVVPLSGSWSDTPTSLMSLHAYSLWFEPLYIAGGFVVSSLFFTFSVQRFRAWVYAALWFVSVLITALFSLSLGRAGLHYNTIINWYTQIWTSGMILFVKLCSCVYLHVHKGRPTALLYEPADAERYQASLPTDGAIAASEADSAVPPPLFMFPPPTPPLPPPPSSSTSAPSVPSLSTSSSSLPLAPACSDTPTAIVAIDSVSARTRREFNHLMQFVLSLLLLAIYSRKSS